MEPVDECLVCAEKGEGLFRPCKCRATWYHQECWERVLETNGVHCNGCNTNYHRVIPPDVKVYVAPPRPRGVLEAGQVALVFKEDAIAFIRRVLIISFMCVSVLVFCLAGAYGVAVENRQSINELSRRVNDTCAPCGS